MIGKLRKKLILAAMGSLLLVLVSIMGGVTFLNYQKLISDADTTLSLLAQNDGFFPNTMQVPPQKGKGELIHGIPPELPFETRYFFATISNEGIIKTVNTGKIAAIDTQTAMIYAQTVFQSKTSSGFLGNYRYLQTENKGEFLILFLDCRRNLESFQTLVLSSILVSLGGAVLVFLLLLFFSNRIVRPFSESYEKQKRFITDAGHELKTPLTIIDADAEILTMDIGENEWVEEIRNQTRRLTALTNDLIFLSRMEETHQTKKEHFSISQMMSDTIQSFEGVAKTKSIKIVSQIQNDIMFCGEQKSIQKLFTILLDNALKYGIMYSTVYCALTSEKNHIKLYVKNDCETVTKEQIHRLFDRFYRTDSSRNSETGGYGLGLSIAQAIVLAHKGKITASTTDGHSLTITVTIPFTKI